MSALAKITWLKYCFFVFFAEKSIPTIHVTGEKTRIKPGTTVKFECNASIEYNANRLNFSVKWDHIHWNGNKTAKIKGDMNGKKYFSTKTMSVSTTLCVTVLPDADGVYICEASINYKGHHYRFYKNTSLTAGNHTLV